MIELQQRQDVYLSLELRIKNVQARQVVFLMHHGWVLCRDTTRKLTWLIFNPIAEWVKFKVSQVAVLALRTNWIEIDEQRGKYLFFRLKEGKA